MNTLKATRTILIHIFALRFSQHVSGFGGTGTEWTLFAFSRSHSVGNQTEAPLLLPWQQRNDPGTFPVVWPLVTRQQQRESKKKHPGKIPDCSSVRLNAEDPKKLLYASEFLRDKSTKRHDDAFSSFFREQSWSKPPGGKWSKQHFCDTVAGHQVGPWFSGAASWCPTPFIHAFTVSDCYWQFSLHTQKGRRCQSHTSFKSGKICAFTENTLTSTGFISSIFCFIPLILFDFPSTFKPLGNFSFEAFFINAPCKGFSIKASEWFWFCVCVCSLRAESWRQEWLLCKRPWFWRNRQSWMRWRSDLPLNGWILKPAWRP